MKNRVWLLFILLLFTAACTKDNENELLKNQTDIAIPSVIEDKESETEAESADIIDNSGNVKLSEQVDNGGEKEQNPPVESDLAVASQLLDMTADEINRKYDINLAEITEKRSVCSVTKEYKYIYIDEIEMGLYFESNTEDDLPVYVGFGDAFGIYEELGLNTFMNLDVIDEQLTSDGYATVESQKLGITYHNAYMKDDLAFVFVSCEEDGYPNKLYISKNLTPNDTYETNSQIDRTDKMFTDFMKGEESAIYTDYDGELYYYNYNEMKNDEEEWTRYYASDTLDIDNDGQYELVLEGPYGGMFLDARDNKIYVLDMGSGTGDQIRYTYYKNKYWIVHTYFSALEEAYRFYSYDKDGNVTETIYLHNVKDTEYHLGEQEISRKEYEEMLSELYLY